jgi:acetyl-CoA carboxylase carboxyl transferase subunit beta
MSEEKGLKCESCGKPLTIEELEANLYVCPKCGSHEKMPARKRIEATADPGSFNELWGDLISTDILEFTDSKPYSDRITESIKKIGENDSIITGAAKIFDMDLALGVQVFDFIGGSMGIILGEKIRRLAEYANDKKVPLVIFCQSGGARMQESVFALMSLARLSSAICKFQKNGGLYIPVLLNPCYGGASASYAFQGDIALAEPGAMVGFAGPRVIEQTIKQKLPKGFQTAEFFLEKGYVDKVVDRKNMRWMLGKLISMYYHKDFGGKI